MNVSSETHGYVQRIRMLSLNAKLYLVATILQGLNFGMWNVLFYLYLNHREVGFNPDFIGYTFTVGALATGFAALPWGLVCERIGPKKAMLLGLTANLVNLVQIATLQPSLILFASLASGLIGTLAWVASAPFMIANCKSEERTYLFSVDWALMVIMGVIGSYMAGFMPDMFNAYLGLPIGAAASVVGYRLSLVVSIVLALASAFPILLIREKGMLQRHKMVELLGLRNIKSHRTILKFMIPTAMIGFGAGFIVPLFNLFFKLKFYATTEQIGVINALGNVTLGIGTLAAPILSNRLGKVKSVVVCEFLSMPFIMFMTLAPNLSLAGMAYIARNSLMNMAGPVSTTLQMELVTETERATTNGLMIMADNIPRAITASISGGMMTVSDFFTPFLFTTTTYFIASLLYFLFFRRAEAEASKALSVNVSYS